MTANKNKHRNAKAIILLIVFGTILFAFPAVDSASVLQTGELLLGDEVKKSKINRNHRGDKTGKSKIFINSFWFEDGSTLQVYCTDWSEEIGHEDELKVVVASKEKLDFITYEAYP